MNLIHSCSLFIALFLLVGCEREAESTQESSAPPERTRIPSDDEIKTMLTSLAASDPDAFKDQMGDSTDPNVKFADGKTLLSAACAGGILEVAEYLIGIGANPAIGDERRVTPLHYAALYGRANVIPALLEAGADLDAEDHLGTTPLALAAAGDSRETLELLLDRGADTTLKNRFGFSPLQSAEMNEKTELAEIIRKHEQKR